jgi:poly-D-alanine transfer protein DltD
LPAGIRVQLDPESKVVPQARSYCEMHVLVQGTGARSSAAQPASFSLNRGVCRKKKKKKKKKKRRKEGRTLKYYPPPS